jgi:hypothetical protein
MKNIYIKITVFNLNNNDIISLNPHFFVYLRIF